MANFIRKFIKLNRNSAAWLEAQLPQIFGAPSYKDELMRLIEYDVTNNKPQSVLEVGGIDRPLLNRGCGFKYVGLDIEERDGCNQIYDQFIVQSIEDAVPVTTGLIISITLMEHVPDNKAAVASMFNAIQPGGVHIIIFHPNGIPIQLLCGFWAQRCNAN